MSSQNRGALFFAGLVTGGVLGAGMAFLLAPQSGLETRLQIRNKSLELKDRTVRGLTEADHRAQEQDTLKEKDAVVEQITQAKHAPTPALMAWADDGGSMTA